MPLCLVDDRHDDDDVDDDATAADADSDDDDDGINGDMIVRRLVVSSNLETQPL